MVDENLYSVAPLRLQCPVDNFVPVRSWTSDISKTPRYPQTRTLMGQLDELMMGDGGRAPN